MPDSVTLPVFIARLEDIAGRLVNLEHEPAVDTEGYNSPAFSELREECIHKLVGLFKDSEQLPGLLAPVWRDEVPKQVADLRDSLDVLARRLRVSWANGWEHPLSASGGAPPEAVAECNEHWSRLWRMVHRLRSFEPMVRGNAGTGQAEKHVAQRVETGDGLAYITALLDQSPERDRLFVYGPLVFQRAKLMAQALEESYRTTDDAAMRFKATAEEGMTPAQRLAAEQAVADALDENSLCPIDTAFYDPRQRVGAWAYQAKRLDERLAAENGADGQSETEHQSPAAREAAGDAQTGNEANANKMRPAIHTATKADEDRGLDKRNRALALVRQHPEWTYQQLADEVGVHPGTMKRWKEIKALKKANRQYAPPPRGYKSANGDIEAGEVW